MSNRNFIFSNLSELEDLIVFNKMSSPSTYFSIRMAEINIPMTPEERNAAYIEDLRRIKRQRDAEKKYAARELPRLFELALNRIGVICELHDKPLSDDTMIIYRRWQQSFTRLVTTYPPLIDSVRSVLEAQDGEWMDNHYYYKDRIEEYFEIAWDNLILGLQSNKFPEIPVERVGWIFGEAAEIASGHEKLRKREKPEPIRSRRNPLNEMMVTPSLKKDAAMLCTIRPEEPSTEDRYKKVRELFKDAKWF